MKTSRIAAPALLALTMLITPTSALAGGRPALASTGVAAGAGLVDQPVESVLVSGKGTILGEPDTLTVNFGVEVNASTVSDALDRANAAAARMRDSLVRGGVGKNDLQTSDVNISARRSDKDKIIAYAVTSALTAEFRNNLAKAGGPISAAITAGGDAARLNGVSFSIDDDTALLTEARRKAFADARGKAELYAREAGRPLGRVIKVNETSSSWGGPVGSFKNYASLAAADSSVPIEPGRQELTVTVTVEWAFGGA